MKTTISRPCLSATVGDGVIVRGALAERSKHDRQAHLSSVDARNLLNDALERYRDVHGNLPATVTVHKTSSFTSSERDGFLAAADAVPLKCELVWLTNSDSAMAIRGSRRYPPLRGTLVRLSEDEHLLYTHGTFRTIGLILGYTFRGPLG
jgi:hypothetical protein